VNLPTEVTQNTSTKIVHQLADDEDAEKVARMLGLNEEQKWALY
jgi:DNA helicase HerA-like ATPase